MRLKCELKRILLWKYVAIYSGYDQDSIAVLTKRYRQVDLSDIIPVVISYLAFDEYVKLDSVSFHQCLVVVFLGCTVNFAVRIITPTLSITQFHIHFVYIYLILSISNSAIFDKLCKISTLIVYHFWPPIVQDCSLAPLWQALSSGGGGLLKFCPGPPKLSGRPCRLAGSRWIYLFSYFTKTNFMYMEKSLMVYAVLHDHA